MVKDTILNCGVDEAGRGPLVGPVVAAAVIIADNFDCTILNDSKKLSPKKREAACAIIKRQCLYGIGVVSHKTIDRVNILEASMRAMKKAVVELLYRNKNIGALNIIIDGNKAPDFSEIERLFDIKITATPIVKADSKINAVMAASIIAKVRRDAIMEEFDKIYPGYNWSHNKGYPTKEHKALCKKLGLSPIARLTFKIR